MNTHDAKADLHRLSQDKVSNINTLEVHAG